MFDAYLMAIQRSHDVGRVELIAERQMCGDRKAEEVAEQIRQMFPDSLPIKDRNLKRTLYLIEHRFDLFDHNHDGRLNIEEFISSEWAGFLTAAPTGRCTVTKEEFMNRYLGDPNDSLSGWHLSFQVQSTVNDYNQYDRSGKGYIDKNDIRHKAMEEFAFTDKNNDGFISIEEHGGKK